jgi:hypothetical protein
MVYGTYLVETAQTIALTVSTWATFVKGGVSTFTAISVSVSLLEAVSTWNLGSLHMMINDEYTIAAMVVQTFYAYRIMIISENKIIPSFIMLVSATQLYL